MVFTETGIDAFRCRPFQFENSTVDWIKMKYLTREPAISEMEAFLRPLMLLMPKSENLDAESRRPRT